MSEGHLGTLSYAVRGRVVLRHVGQLVLVLAATTSVSLAVSVATGDYAMAMRYGAVVAALAAFGGTFGRLRAPADLRSNEALAITALVFLLAPLLMTFPLGAAGLRFEDALFEAVSAVTTTGLSTLPTVENKPTSFLFSRAWLQWVGGLGIVVLSVALLMRPGTAARRLVDVDWEESGILGGTRLYARIALRAYIVLTAAGILVLILLGVKSFPALVHSLAAVSTGGFSSHDRSLADLGSWPARFTVLAISVAGALSLAFYHRAAARGWREAARDAELRALALLIVLGSAALATFMALDDGIPWARAVRHGPAMLLSAQTTAGFATVAVTDLGPGSVLVLIFAMAVGGSIGSTAGGAKLFRLLVVVKLLRLLVRRTALSPHAVVEPRLEGRRLESEEIERVLLVVVLFLAVMLLSWAPFVVMGHDPLASLFEVVSATATVGLSAGITAPDLHPLLKGVLCADMLMGRLEIVALLVVLYPGTWFGRRAPTP